jgi:hypothetical protein
VETASAGLPRGLIFAVTYKSRSDLSGLKAPGSNGYANNLKLKQIDQSNYYGYIIRTLGQASGRLSHNLFRVPSRIYWPRKTGG